MKSIRSFLIAVIVCLVLGVGVMATFVAYGFARSTAMDIIHGNLLSLANSVSSYIAADIEKEIAVLQALAYTDEITSNTWTLEDKAEYLAPYRDLDPSRITYAVIDSQGHAVTTGGVAVDLSDREYFKRAMQGEIVVSDPLVDRAQQTDQTLTYAVPIRDRQTRTIIGALLSDKDVRYFSEMLAGITIGQSGGPYVISNATGDTIGHYRSFSHVGENIEQLVNEDSSLRALASYNAAMRSGMSGIGEYTYNGTEYLTAFTRLPSEYCDWSIACSAPISEFTEGIRAMLRVMIVMAVLICVIGVTIAVVIATSIANPISVIRDSLESIAEGEGDLTVRLEVRGNNEIAAISRSFNQFVETLSSMIGNVQNNASSMGKIATALSDNVTDISGRASSITGDIERLHLEADEQSASVTETSSAITQIAQTIEALSGKIESQSSSVTESSAAVQEMISNINSISANVSMAAESFDELKGDASSGKESITNVQELVNKLSAQSDSLLEANSVIESIAAQTNLLAMNAAIEAAHAGDAGKGFAVVAEEIRVLAENSSEQSRAIASTLKEAVKAFKDIENAASLADSSFDSVVSKISAVTSLVGEINFSMSEQSAGSRQVLEGLHDIENITAQIMSGALEMNGGAVVILKEVRRLQEASQTVKERSASIASASEAISEALGKIEVDSSSNSTAIGALVSITEGFKLRS